MLHQLELQINQAHGIDGRFAASCHATMHRQRDEFGDGLHRSCSFLGLAGLCQEKVKQRLRSGEVLVKSIFSKLP
jgi:hypothetical protein